MKHLANIGIVVTLLFLAAACADSNQPNYQYMPNMYESVGYETYEGVNNGLFPQGTEALLPAEHTIPRGYRPYTPLKTPLKAKNRQGKTSARSAPSKKKNT